MKGIEGVILCLVIIIVFCAASTCVIVHDGEILKDANNCATKQYFTQFNTTMSWQDRWELSHSICNDTFTNETLRDKLILPSAINWDMCIERCEYRIMGVKLE